MATKTPKKTKASGKLVDQAVERPVKYPEVAIEEAWGATPVTVEHAIFLLGATWDEDEVKKFKDQYGIKWLDPLFKDADNKPVWCLNNINNRPFYQSNFSNLTQTILNRRWAGPNGMHEDGSPNGDRETVNGEPILIGKTALVLNGQHTLPALIVADQLRQKHARWMELWDGQPCVIDKLIVYGLSETDRVVNTMDTCKARSISDVIFRSEYFRNKKPEDRKAAAKITDMAIRLLWHRTGNGEHSFSPRRTHDEVLNFLEKHPRLMRCVSHVYDENSDNSIKEYINLGFAAGMMYMMAASQTGEGVYLAAVRGGEAKEELIDFSMWDKAVEFWAAFGKGDGVLNVARKLLKLVSTNSEKLAILVKAWRLFASNQKMTDGSVKPKYDTDPETQISTIAECPDLGGIDLGDPKDQGDGDEPPPAKGQPTKKEIEAAKEQEIKRREENRDKRKARKAEPNLEPDQGFDLVPEPEPTPEPESKPGKKKPVRVAT